MHTKVLNHDSGRRPCGRASVPTAKTERVQVMDLETLVGRLGGAPGRADSLTHLEVVAARPAVRRDWPDWLRRPACARRSRRVGVTSPWTHQREAADLAHQRSAHRGLDRHRVGQVARATCCPGCRRSSPPRARRGSAARACSTWRPRRRWPRTSSPRCGASTSPTCAAPPTTATPRRSMREWTRDHAEYVLTNPDMLHRSLLPGHARWSRFFGSLRYVVVDECHHYRGVFGAHVAADPAAAAAGGGAVRRAPDLRAGLGDRRRAGGLGRPADRPRGRRRHRRRLAPRAARRWRCGSRRSCPGRGERRSRTPLGDQRGRRPADRPRRRAGAHARLRPVPAWRGDRRR